MDSDRVPTREIDAAPYRVDDDSQIVNALTSLQDSARTIHLHTNSGALGDAWLTLKDERLQFDLKTPLDEAALATLDFMGVLSAVALTGAVKLQFDDLRLVVIDAKTLVTGWPGQFYRIQRRSAFRVRVPLTQRAVARVPLPGGSDSHLTLRIVDLSTTGCALEVPTQGPAFVAGTHLSHVQLDIDAETRFYADIAIVHVKPATEGTRLGCGFVDLGGATERALQRCVDRIQRRQRWAQVMA